MVKFANSITIWTLGGGERIVRLKKSNELIKK